MKSDVIIFDGSHAAHRISAATPPLTNSKGARTEVVFGLLRLLSSVLRANQAKRCILVWDGPGCKEIRQKIDPEYKAHRHNSDSEDDKERLNAMHEQLDRFWIEFGQFMPVDWLTSSKYEADDIMAMRANVAVNSGKTCLIVTGDKDLLQLVDTNISVYSPFGNKYCIKETFGTYTKGFPNGRAWLAAKCLMGDTSDNIKGVGGIGEVTALRILQDHDWDLGVLKHAPSPALASTKIGQKLATEAAWKRISDNYALMSLFGPSHQRFDFPIIKHRVGIMDTKQLQMNMAKNQFASLIAGFTQFIAPFRLLGD